MKKLLSFSEKIKIYAGIAQFFIKLIGMIKLSDINNYSEHD